MKKASSKANEPAPAEIPENWPGGKVIASFTIPGKLDGINEYVRACRCNPYVGAKMKRENEETCLWATKAGMKDIKEALPIEKPVIIHYLFIEVGFRRDLDNISGFAHKVFQDALTGAGVLKDDNFKYIKGYTDTFVEGGLPRIEVRLTEA